MQDLKFTEAEAGDVEQIIQVVNAAYRGETSKLGWTTEADLLDGLRTDEKELLQLLTDEASCILLCKTQDTVLGSVHLQYMGDCVEIGMFAVNPLHQGRGIGKQLLQHAESIAIKTWSIQRLQMVVISCRYELLAFYHRRGYRNNGGTKAFPENPLLWTPKVKNLQFTLLEKTL